MAAFVAAKTCRKCGRAFPATDDHFRRYKRNASGLAAICHSCEARYRRRRYRTRPHDLATEVSPRLDADVFGWLKQHHPDINVLPQDVWKLQDGIRREAIRFVSPPWQGLFPKSVLNWGESENPVRSPDEAMYGQRTLREALVFDLEQEGWAGFFEQLPKYRGDASLHTFGLKAARGRMLDAILRERRFYGHALSDTAVSGEGESISLLDRIVTLTGGRKGGVEHGGPRQIGGTRLPLTPDAFERRMVARIDRQRAVRRAKLGTTERKQLGRTLEKGGPLTPAERQAVSRARRKVAKARMERN